MADRRQMANAIRFLSMDAVQKANSGHPGAPMGMADIAEVLWNDYLKHNPNNPDWPNRDRFVLSNGHASMLLYALLHLSGYALPIEELQNFRQLHSATPGHPEKGYTAGVETTTGPLGQGLANAVGMALAEKMLAAQFNRPDFQVIDHRTFVFLGDGCMMEGISHEVCSLAGTWHLNKLIAFYDDNGISIDGHVDAWFSDNTPVRFEAYGWQVIRQVNGHDPHEIKAAIETAIKSSDRPTLICCRTTIGYGSPSKQGKEECHGAPLGNDEIIKIRQALEWESPAFDIPKKIAEAWDARQKGENSESQWRELWQTYETRYPELATELKRRWQGQLPANFLQVADQFVNEVNVAAENIATRKASQNTLNRFAPVLPELVGGSADLTGSNLTAWKDAKSFDHLTFPVTPNANYIHYGVREFGMAAIMNGLSVHGGLRPFGGTFLMFMEYARNAIRMAALMKLPVIYVFTHDSIGLGEDGPTHQPIEQLTALRVTPNLTTWRPADAVETAVAWKEAILNQQGPTALILSRQNLPHCERNNTQITQISQGGYVLWDSDSDPQLLLLATGSEIQLAMAVAKGLIGKVSVRVVSLPSHERFDAQSAAYRESVLPKNIRCRLAIEAGHPDIWFKYTGLDGAIMGINTFGESGPADALFKHFKLTVEDGLQQAKTLMAHHGIIK